MTNQMHITSQLVFLFINMTINLSSYCHSILGYQKQKLNSPCNYMKIYLFIFPRNYQHIILCPRCAAFTTQAKPQVVDMLNWPAGLQLTIFSGILCPLRYLTFSCSVFIISVNFLPSTNSSYTYICTCSWKESGCSLTVTPIMRAITEPLGNKQTQRLSGPAGVTCLTF